MSRELRSQRIYKIHPAIGIARVGNAEADTFFIGPEIPGQPPTGDPGCGTMVPPYKADPDKEKIKPQATRFRIWEYERNADDLFEARREIKLGDPDVRGIKWTVHLANRKAAFHEFDGAKGETKPPAKLRNDRYPDFTIPGPVPLKPSDRARLLEIDPGPRSIGGRSKPGVAFSPNGRGNWPTYPAAHPRAGEYVIDYLGELRTDAAGRLIVIGGKGAARSLYRFDEHHTVQDAYNNYWWFDDTADGPVTAEVLIVRDGRLQTVEPLGAWAVVGPPDFAPDMSNIVTLHDVLYDMAVWDLDLPEDEAVYHGALDPLRQLNDELRVRARKELQDFVADFDRDVGPIFASARDHRWVLVTAADTHTSLGSGPDNADVIPVLRDASSRTDSLRATVFGRVRPPREFKNRLGQKVKLGGKAKKTQTMPMLYGEAVETPLTLTRTQYVLLERWMRGAFTASAAVPSPEVTPHGLDKAALESANGGAFHPGIEVGWQIRNPKLFLEPFRIDHEAKDQYWGKSASTIKAGHFTRQIAVPWHTDFLHCMAVKAVNEYDPRKDEKTTFGWWPAQRPDHVKPERVAAADENNAPRWRRTDWFRPSKGGLFDWPIDPQQEERFVLSEFRYNMVAHWHKMGFVVLKDGQMLETERTDKPIP